MPGSGRMSATTDPNLMSATLRPLGRTGKAAVALFAVHILLLFATPLPPYVKGSLWSYVLGYIAVILVAMELRAQAPAMVRWCGRVTTPGVAALGAAAVAAVLVAGLTLRRQAPDLFALWSREEGVWEPLTVTMFLAAAFLLFQVAQVHQFEERRHLKLFGALFVLLTLEEVDYLGIFGGMVGRVEGVYVGSPHDLIALAANDLLPIWAAAILAGFVGATAALLVRSGYLQPVPLARTILAFRGLWLITYVLIIGLAQVEDLSLVYLLGEPRIEELLELTGAIVLLAFAVDVTADAVRRDVASRQTRTIVAERHQRPPYPALAGSAPVPVPEMGSRGTTSIMTPSPR